MGRFIRVARRFACLFLPVSRLLTLSILITSCTMGGHGSPSFVPGEAAPDFNLHAINGNKDIHLSDFKGKVVLLNFWASWCGPCVSELPALEQLQNEMQSKGLVVLGVGVDDDADSLAEFTRTYGLTYPVALDTDGSVKRTYKLGGVPESFIIDRDGNFFLLLDPADNSAVVRVVGPREWTAPTMIDRLSAILAR